MVDPVEDDQGSREAKATALAKAWENVPQLRRSAKSFQLVLALYKRVTVYIVYIHM